MKRPRSRALGDRAARPSTPTPAPSACRRFDVVVKSPGISPYRRRSQSPPPRAARASSAAPRCGSPSMPARWRRRAHDLRDRHQGQEHDHRAAGAPAARRRPSHRARRQHRPAAAGSARPAAGARVLGDRAVELPDRRRRRERRAPAGRGGAQRVPGAPGLARLARALRRGQAAPADRRQAAHRRAQRHRSAAGRRWRWPGTTRRALVRPATTAGTCASDDLYRGEHLRHGHARAAAAGPPQPRQPVRGADRDRSAGPGCGGAGAARGDVPAAAASPADRSARATASPTSTIRSAPRRTPAWRRWTASRDRRVAILVGGHDRGLPWEDFAAAMRDARAGGGRSRWARTDRASTRCWRRSRPRPGFRSLRPATWPMRCAQARAVLGDDGVRAAVARRAQLRRLRDYVARGRHFAELAGFDPDTISAIPGIGIA